MTDNLVLIRGDTNKINVYVRRQVFDGEGEPVRDTDGTWTYTPISLDGAALTFTARTRAGVEAFQMSTGGGSIATVGDPDDGVARITIAPAVTEDYSVPTWLDYDIELIEADSTKTTLVRGQLVISKDQTFT